MPKILTRYEHQRLPGLVFGPSLAKQSEAGACDINRIMERACRTGALPVSSRIGRYLDVSQVGDYQSSLERLREADDMFSALPATVRRRFDNDPAKMLDFVADAANREEAIDLGLIDKPKVEAPKIGESVGTTNEGTTNEQ